MCFQYTNIFTKCLAQFIRYTYRWAYTYTNFDVALRYCFEYMFVRQILISAWRIMFSFHVFNNWPTPVLPIYCSYFGLFLLHFKLLYVSIYRSHFTHMSHEIIWHMSKKALSFNNTHITPFYNVTCTSRQCCFFSIRYKQNSPMCDTKPTKWVTKLTTRLAYCILKDFQHTL